MTDTPDDKSGSVQLPSSAPPEIAKPPRRLFVLRVAAILGGMAAAAFATTQEAQAQRGRWRPRRRRKSADGIYYGQDTVAGHSHDTARSRRRR